MSYEIAKERWSTETYGPYLKTLPKAKWAKGVTIHHTAYPNLAMRPLGLTDAHQRNLLYYYKNKKRWSDGPHLFIDDKSILGMSGLLDNGVHSVGFNSTHIGIEVLGDYDKEDPYSGRGRQCWNILFYTVAETLKYLGLEPNSKTVTFHREDGHTSKSCPGRRIKKQWVLDGVKRAYSTSKAYTLDKVSQPQDKPRVPNWTEYKLMDAGWFVPVLEFMEHIGGDTDKIIEELDSKDGKIFYQGDLIENAYYDTTKQKTYALATELLGFV